MIETYGCDFAWTKPDPIALRNAGYTFVLGYISNNPTKDLSGAQIAQYAKAGLRVALVFETTANRVLSGATGGREDGIAANVAAHSRGYATNAPVFYAVDFPVDPSQYPVVDAYGSAFNLANERIVGPYADFAYIEHAVTPGVQPNQVGWQTAAWSNGLLSKKAAIYQRAIHTHPLVVPANQFDEDVICRPILMHGGMVYPGGVKPVPVPPIQITESGEMSPLYILNAPGDEGQWCLIPGECYFHGSPSIVQDWVAKGALVTSIPEEAHTQLKSRYGVQ